MSHRRLRVRATGQRARRAVGTALAVGLAVTVLSACEVGGPEAAGQPSASGASESPEKQPPFRVTGPVVRKNRQVPVDRVVRLGAKHGTLEQVRVTSELGRLPGRLAKDGSSWSATGRLEPGVDYRVRVEGRRTDGKRVTRVSRFHTEDLTLDEQTYPSVAPLAGETVGVGMPVIVTFDVPVTDRASIEKHMRVTSTPQQPGAWHWLSDQEVHWRPKSYWQAGSEVSVDVDINSVPAGNGVYGQESRRIDFQVGDAHVYKVNMATQQMQVFSNGALLRTMPITTGKPGFTTRSGTKVIIEKYRRKRMNSETIGISRDDPEYYNIAKVEHAMRVTYSGEFIHAAPWSVESQGNANVSHGCTGMSPADAAWLYDMTIRGDVVEYTGSDRPMTLTNGYGDWNASFADWREGSALS